MTVNKVTEHQPWCSSHVVDGTDADPNELDYCRHEVPFPGGYVELHDYEAPVVEVVVGSEVASMAPAEAAQFVVALIEVLMVHANGGRS